MLKLFSGSACKSLAFFLFLLYNVGMKNQIRVPKQARSIEKKQKIIDASYKLFAEVGYYGTNTAEIAKYAGVSTGIVYEYFHDKHDILICVLDNYIENVYGPIFALFDTIKTLDYAAMIPAVLDKAVAEHENNIRIHEVLHSLSSTDAAVNEAFLKQEDSITFKFVKKLEELGETSDGLYEKVHLGMNIIQSYCHEYVSDRHEYIDYGYMKSLVCKLVGNLFK